MTKKIQRIGLLVFILAIALLSFANVGVMSADAAVEAGSSYGWVYIANDVSHCDTGGEDGCSPQSAHTWETE